MHESMLLTIDQGYYVAPVRTGLRVPPESWIGSRFVTIEQAIEARPWLSWVPLRSTGLNRDSRTILWVLLSVLAEQTVLSFLTMGTRLY
jgi:hypothetical protein